MKTDELVKLLNINDVKVIDVRSADAYNGWPSIVDPGGVAVKQGSIPG